MRYVLTIATVSDDPGADVTGEGWSISEGFAEQLRGILGEEHKVEMLMPGETAAAAHSQSIFLGSAEG